MWWRRHSSLWPRSLHPNRIICDTDTLLRSTESLLRSSRTFSKSPSTTQQKHIRDHGDVEDNHSSRSFHVDYKKWKRELERRMVEDPYRVLFGASEGRLKGLGFGRGWMEMGMGWMEKDVADKDKVPDTKAAEKAEIPKTSIFARHMPPSTSDPTPGSRTYPTKVNISSDDSFTKREPFKLGRSESSAGVVSPSDPRRLHQQPEHTVNYQGNPRAYQIEGHNVSAETFANFTEWQNTQQARQGRMEGHKRRAETVVKKMFAEEEATQKIERLTPKEAEYKAAKIEATTRETELISESLNGSSARTPSAQACASAQDSIDSKDWKQTVLDRRAGNKFTPRSRASFKSVIRARQRRLAALHNDLPTKIRVAPKSTVIESDVLSDAKEDASTANILDTQSSLPGAQFWHHIPEQGRLLDDITQGHPTSKAAAQEDSLFRLHEAKAQKTNIESFRKPAFTRSTSEVLSQLPKDDIDFLSAADIRAAMGVKKAQEVAAKSRADLEKNFKEAHTKEMELDSMIESKILNDKHMRRLEGVLNAKQKAKIAAQEASSSESILETSLNNLTKMIQDGGECFTRYLWTDPVDANRSIKRSWDPILVDVVHTLRQNRDSFREISQDLENDIPTTKHLLKGLRDFESRAIGSVVSLARYCDIPERAAGSELRKKHDDAVESLKLVNYQPEMLRQMEQAFQTIDLMRILKVSEDMQERLQIAETVLKGNAESTRTMWRTLLRTHTLGKPEPLKRVFCYHIRAVSDFQSSLLSVVQSVMRRFDVPRRHEEQNQLDRGSFSGIMSEARTEERTTSDEVNKISAANLKLAEEIQTQKDAMCGLSGDGHRRAPKPSPVTALAYTPVKKKTLDELKPLANSLFRPFGLQLESLGKEEEVVVKERKHTAQEVRDTTAKENPHREKINEVYEGEKGDASSALQVKQSQIETEQARERTSAENRAAVVPSLTERVVNLFLREPEVETAKAREEAPASTSPPVNRAGIFTLEDQNEDIVGKALTKPPSVPEREPDAPVIDLSKSTIALASSTQASPEEPVVKSAPTPYISLAPNVPETTREALPPPPPAPTTYKILTYNPTTDELSITTATAPFPAEGTLPLPAALLRLDHPGKFTPHLPKGFEVVRTKSDMLILRESGVETKLHTETVKFKFINTDGSSSEPAAPTSQSVTEEMIDRFAEAREAPNLRHFDKVGGRGIWRDGIPKDSLPRFPLGLQHNGSKDADMIDKGLRREGRRRRSVGLVKTVVWAGAGCYALGILGELFA